MITSAQVRQKLVEALQLDLVGPTPDDSNYATEILNQAPSKWYLTGFLAPLGAPLDLKCDDTVNEELDQSTESKLGDDNLLPETTAAKKVPFPSSMGLSFLISETVTELTANVSWGDYLAIETELVLPLETEENKAVKPETIYQWQRISRSESVTIYLESMEGKTSFDVPNSKGLKLVVINRSVKNLNFPAGTRSVSVFLVNYRNSYTEDFFDASLAFQTHLSLYCEEGFIPRSDPRSAKENGDWDEAVASVQYRHDYEFAVGHNVSANAHINTSLHQHNASMDSPLCQTIATTWQPITEVPKVSAAEFSQVELGMEAIASAPDAETIQTMVGPLITLYENWIADQRQTKLTGEEQQVAEKLLDNAERACQRMAAGLASLQDSDVLSAFKIANRSIARARRQQLADEQKQPAESFKPPQWRPFQLAFILLNLLSIAQPEKQEREVVDLLFFPTGGGKTEAYLGLAAFTLVLRRLRYPGIHSAGLSVLMRYTLRLLTLDQLERAARLICALELERDQQPKLGSWPFEIGLWVGSAATPNKMGRKGKQDKYCAREKTLAFQKGKSPNSPIPLEKCPWCGTKFGSNSFQLFPNPDQPTELRILCSNRRCKFRGDRPLPIVAIDESIYRRLPCFLIATVDKFASLPWVGQTGALFGNVTHFRDDEGFFGPADTGKAGIPLKQPLPPPDLIIQDELHLISGPLGTMVGLYETAIDRLCQRENQGIRPKIIASTATVRRAERQIQALFDRSQVDIFPPPGPDRHDSFFAKTEWEADGRLYVGVAAQGRSPKVVMLRVYLALLAAAQKQWQLAAQQGIIPNPADPYLTLLGYFNSLRELGGSRRLVEDEVNPQLRKYGDRRVRVGENISPFFSNRKIDDEPEELTSRVSTNKVAETKNNLSQPFDIKKSRSPYPYKKVQGVDVALATNMISVGLDIVRLGLMVVLGQPKSAAEYIQSTSRVGRDGQRPGLVVTLLNIHRPRDRSHYERFQNWHHCFYRAVEATSVTPFSPRALDRGLAGVAVGLARHGIAKLTNPLGASDVGKYRAELEELWAAIIHRAENHHPEGESDQSVLSQDIRSRLAELLNLWEDYATKEDLLQYNPSEIERASPLLLSAFNPNTDKEPLERRKFKTQWSLRDVEPTVNIWVKDGPEKRELGD